LFVWLVAANYNAAILSKNYKMMTHLFFCQNFPVFIVTPFLLYFVF